MVVNRIGKNMIMWFAPVANTKSNSRLNGLKKRRRKPPFLCNIVKFLHIFVIYYQSEIDKAPYKHNQNILNMTTIYKPGQILWLKSAMGPWYYISVLHHTTPVGRMGREDELHTCCDLCVDTDGDCLTFARGNGTFLDLDTSFAMVREATDVEREYLYKVLVKAFKDHDLGWDKHFTDSTYFDILDWLAWEFSVDLDANQNTPLGETINEIQNYIWDALCKETGNYQACTDYVEPEMVNKDEFVAKVRNWLEKHTYDDKYWTPDGDDLFLGNLIGDICKYLEE